MNKKITVLMAVYNGERYLNEAINSILTQTFTDFEFLIIDDASTDRTPEILQRYNDNRIRIITNEKNLGLASSLNRGLKLASGDYIARMDADDISLPSRLEKQVTFMDNNPDFIVCATQRDPIGNKGLYKPGSFYRFPDTHEKIKCSLLFGCIIPHPSVMIRKKVLVDNEIKYSEDELFRTAQDYELWSRLINLGNFYIIPEKLLKYRYHSKNSSKKISQNTRNKRNNKIMKQFFSSYGIPFSEEKIPIHLSLIYCCIPDGIQSVLSVFLWIIQLYIWNFHAKVFSRYDMLYELTYSGISYFTYVLNRNNWK